MPLRALFLVNNFKITVQTAYPHRLICLSPDLKLQGFSDNKAHLAISQENLSTGFLTRSDTHRTVQPQKKVRV